MTKKRSLVLKFIIGFVLVGIIMAALAMYFGYTGFRDSMVKQYHDTAYLIADTAEDIILDTVTKEELAEFVEIARGDDTKEQERVMSLGRYQKIWKELNDLRESMQLTDIYLTYYDPEVLRGYQEGDTDWKPLLYIIDCYYKEDEIFLLGQSSSMNPKNRVLFAEVMETGKNQDDFIISNGDFGYNISALKPILSADGEVIAVIAVEEPMRLVESSTRSFLIRTMSSIMVAILVVIILFVIYMYRSVILPVNIVASEAIRFGNNNEISDAAMAKLNAIKTGDEIQLLSMSIGKMERDMIAYVDNIKSITAEKERIGAELNVATKIQADMLPSLFPAFPEREDMDIFASMDPAKEVGGDFYDLFMVGEDRLAVVMADVSGKGVPAALFMVIAKTLIKNHLQNNEPVDQVLRTVNNQLCEGNEQMLFVTTWIAIIDIKTGYIEFSDAGHEITLVLHPDGTVDEVNPAKKRPPLAAMEDMEYMMDTTTINKGDVVFLYTDGVPEATNAEGELYGMDRLKNILQKSVGLKPQDLLVAVRKDVDEFVGDADQFDDLTMLAFQKKI